MRMTLFVPFAAAVLLACTGSAGSAALLDVHGNGTTGLEGTVTRGPVMPVCRVGVPCDAPFSAAFDVAREGRTVARFQSDSAGHYRVLLAPGSYTIAPDSSAPVWPKGQSRPATVGPVGMTHLDLEFDTGIR